jgi:hypothetical protein
MHGYETYWTIDLFDEEKYSFSGRKPIDCGVLPGKRTLHLPGTCFAQMPCPSSETGMPGLQENELPRNRPIC